MKTLIEYPDGQRTRGFPLDLFRGRVRHWSLDDVVRRALEIVLSSLLLAVLSPIMLVVAAAVKLDSRGPALFHQVRTGRNRRREDWSIGAERRTRELFGRPFTLYKFR